MEKINILRKKYPRFIYEKYFWKILGRDLNISFDFRIQPNIKFRPRVIIKNIEKDRVKRIGNRVLNNLVFNLGLIEILSYWKATCSPEIKILAGPLNKEQILWWKDLIIKGMGQFFYENKINFLRPSFLKISSNFVPKDTDTTFSTAVENRVLVPVGGGKDSVVTLEILKKNEKELSSFSLNPTEAAQKIMKIAGGKEPIIVRRKIDEKLFELNRQGFLNGHAPFSAELAFLSVLVATIFGQKYIVLSNERSANEGNLKYLGKMINHQWSKSFEFEKKFREYSKKYLIPEVEYFSFLRPLYEIQIAKLFSKYPQYFNAFLSCNVAYQTASGTKKPTKTWCGKCPKCLFVFASLYPFVETKKLIKIFRKNLFKDKKLLPLMLQLIGERKFKPRNTTSTGAKGAKIAERVEVDIRGKPFECVGTTKESFIAFYLSYKKYRGATPVNLPALLKYFEEKILPKYKNLEKESIKILNSWNNQNYLPKCFEKILKGAITTS